VQRLKLQDGGELLGATDLMSDDVRSDLAGERQREPHRNRTVTASSRVSTDRAAWLF
jgi:predicted kinase